MAKRPSIPDEGNPQGGKCHGSLLLASDAKDLAEDESRTPLQEAWRASPGSANGSSSLKTIKEVLKHFNLESPSVEGPSVQSSRMGMMFGTEQTIREGQTSTSSFTAGFASGSCAFPYSSEIVRRGYNQSPSSRVEDIQATQMVEGRAHELSKVSSAFDMQRMMSSLTNLPKNVQSQVMSELCGLSALKLDDSEPAAACINHCPVESAVPACSSNEDGSTMGVADGNVRKTSDSQKSDDLDGAFKRPVVAKVMRTASGTLDSKILIFDEEKHTCEGLSYYFQNPYTTELLARRIPHDSRHVFSLQKNNLAAVNRRQLAKSSKRMFQVHPTDKVHICPFCKQPFRNPIFFRVHLRGCHGIRLMFVCAVCHDKCDNEIDFYQHMSAHKKKASYACKVCGINFEHKTSLSYHRLTHFEVPDTIVEGLDKLFTCPFCGKTFKERGRLSQHTRCHARGPAYKCDTCGETFDLQSTFTKHKLLHSTACPFACPTCDMTFSNADDLRIHRKVHLFSTDVKVQTKKAQHAATARAKDSNSTASSTSPSYNCATCGQVFRCKTGLLQHELVHLGIMICQDME